MKRVNSIVLGTLVIAALGSTAAHAWNIYRDNGTWAIIKCSDGSMAAVAQTKEGTWTVTEAGAKGQTGGSFAIVGQAALRACGE